jgi:hypothetical protein
MGSVQDIAPEWLSFIRASEWGIVWKRKPVKEGLADSETYIHHGAGGRMGNDHKQAMRTLQKWYHDSKNYSTIAYDVMVHRSLGDDTVAICGAREGWLSAATEDRNDIGEAICLFGYFHPGSALSEQPTERELEALAFAVAWSIEMGWSAPDTKVLGHRDNPAHPGASSCPGNYLYPHVQAIGRRAQELLALANKPPEPEPEPTPIPQPPIPTDPIPGDDMSTKTILNDTRNGAVYLCDAISKTWVDNGHVAQQIAFRVQEAMGNNPDYSKPAPPWPPALRLSSHVAIDGHRYSVVTHGDPNLIASFGPIIGPRPSGVDEYGR